MSTLTVKLPQSLYEFVEAKAAQAGFRDPEQFVVAVLQSFREKASIEVKLRDAIDGNELEEVTPSFWDSLRARVAQGANLDGAG